ncbi:hypothetical protein BDV12DRAFT_200054 [Aspergillus spectabilis]
MSHIRCRPKRKSARLFRNTSIFHVQHPFLEPTAIWATVTRVEEYRQLTPNSMSDEHRHNLFQLYMVMSIGAVRSFRRGEASLHPFGFFTAALQVMAPRGFCFNRLEDIQNFLLIGRFGVYFYIGCSIWEIGRICIRICIELSLHREPAGLGEDQEQRLIVFWESYSLDRFASSMLGRPFGIDDNDIEIPTPAMTQTLQYAHGVFAHMVELACISSNMRRALTGEDGTVPNADSGIHRSRRVGSIYATLGAFFQKLTQWRATAPIREMPTCIFHMPEYFELRYQEERLALLRAAIETTRPGTPPDRCPDYDASAPWAPLHGKLSSGFPSHVIEKSCLEAAVGIICAYDVLQRRGVIMYSRYYMQVLFSSGILIILVVFSRVDKKSRVYTEHTTIPVRLDAVDYGSGPSSLSHGVVDVSDWLSLSFVDSNRGEEISLDRALEAIHIAGGLLSWLAQQMPDSALYSRVFDALKQSLERMARRYNLQQTRATTRDHADVLPVHTDSLNVADILAQNSHNPDLSNGLDYSPSVDTETSLTHLLEELLPNMPANMLGDFNGEPEAWPLSQIPFMPGLMDYDFQF